MRKLLLFTLFICTLNTVLRAQEQPQKVALVLPFNLARHDGQSARMLEFYEGALLAVDTLKQRGVSIDLKVYDNMSGAQPISADIIIGGYSVADINTILQTSSSASTIVLPFTSNTSYTTNRPNVFIVNTPQAKLYSGVYASMAEYFPKTTYLLLDTDGDKQDKSEFIASLQAYATDNNIECIRLSAQTTAEQLVSHVKDKRVLLIPTSGSLNCLELWLPKLTALLGYAQNNQVVLFGYPEWQTYAATHASDFHRLNTYFYSTFYTNAGFPSAHAFNSKFRHWFHKQPTQGFPTMAMLGYDIFTYFLSRTSNLAFAANATLQNGFSFQQNGLGNGYYNMKLYFIHYSPNYQVTKTELY